jgi:F0F1-type ATP synthase membrane subunit b/b'
MIKNPDLELKKARKRGRKIVEEAKIKALRIIADAYGEEIQKIASELAVEFKNEAVIELSRFKSELENKIVTIEEAAEKVLAQEYDELKVELENYKASKIAQIDATARETLIDVTKKVLGKSIDLRSHEELLIKSLEEAKKQNLF